MSKFGDLNELLTFAKQNGVSVQIEYWESDDTMSVSVISAAPDEEYGEKRILNVGAFMDNWREYMISKGFRPVEKDEK